MDPALRELLGDGPPPDGDRLVEAIVRLRDPLAVVPGVRLVACFGDIATCRLPYGAILAARQHPDVWSLKAARLLGPEPEPTPDRRPRELPVRPMATDIRRPSALRETGEGVVVGLADWEIDFDHPAFKRDGLTRLRALWDQRGPAGERTPRRYGYGTHHRRTDIDRALRTADPYDALGYHPAGAARGHGTHVADVAAGGGAVGPAGLAPGSELVFIHLGSDRSTIGLGSLGTSVRLLEAVDYFVRAAGRRPWVINLSVGRCGGPHDGTTLVEQAFDNLLAAAPGRMIVQSTGNYSDRSLHSSDRLATGQTRVLTFVTDAADRTLNELEVWYPGTDEFAVRLRSPAGEQGPWVALGDDADIADGRETVGRIYHRERDPNGDHHIDLFLRPSAPAGAWDLELRAVRAQNGRYHAWLERDEACTPCQARFVPDHADSSYTLGTIACGRLPVTVGAYNAHAPQPRMARFSSAGPTRSEQPKPDFVAPGEQVLAARSAPPGAARSPGLLVRKSGTSMAAPHLTGAIALALGSTGGRLSAEQMRRLLVASAQPLPGAPRMRAGHGVVDVRRFLELAAAAAPRLKVLSRAEELAMHTPGRTIPDPERLYRDVVHGREPRAALDGLVVVTRPREPVQLPVQPGDLLVRVTPGVPGRGRTAVVLDSALQPREAIDGLSPADDTGPGLYAPATDDAGAHRHCRVADLAGRMPLGQLLLRTPSTNGATGQEEAAPASAEDIDETVAVPPFSAQERGTVRTPLLDPKRATEAAAWTSGGRVGVPLERLRGALARYVDAVAVAQALQSADVESTAVLVECVHQFQLKCYLDVRDHDGRAGASTLDSLGLIRRAGRPSSPARKVNTTALHRLRDRAAEVRAADPEFTADNWFDHVIDPTVFGLRAKRRLGLHLVLVRRLRQAERYLLTLPAYQGLTPAGLGRALGLTERHSGLRLTPDSASMHTLGLAIDIGPTANPHLRSRESWQALKRAAQVVAGVELTAGTVAEYFHGLGESGQRSTREIWTEIHRRHTELQRYLTLADDTASKELEELLRQRGAQAVNPGESLPHAVTRWQGVIRQDVLALQKTDFSGRSPRNGLMSLPADLVVALRDHACLIWGAVDIGPDVRARGKGSGDIMHFDARLDGVGAALARGVGFVPKHHPCLHAAEPPPAAEGLLDRFLGQDCPPGEHLVRDAANFVPQIRFIMAANGWRVASWLQTVWVGGAANQLVGAARDGRGNTGPLRVVNVSIDWALAYERAAAAYRALVRPEVYASEEVQETLLNQLDALFDRQGGSILRFGRLTSPTTDPRARARELEEDYVTHRTLGKWAAYRAGVDELNAALGRFTMYAVPAGWAVRDGRRIRVTIERVGVYLRDSYDFNGEQGLGQWRTPAGVAAPWESPGDGDIAGGRLPRCSGQWVALSNWAYRTYRERTGLGEDFLVYSDVKVAKLATPVRI